jgi:PEP-CTERM motif.
MDNLFKKELGGISGGDIATYHNSKYGLFHNIQSSSFFAYYWTNQELTDDKSYAETYSFRLGLQLGWGKDEDNYAWAVRQGDVPMAPGFTPQNPILPSATLPNGWLFSLTIPNELLYIDPQVAVGYDYLLDSGPNFTSVLLPSVGDDHFSLYLWNGTEWAFDSTLNAGMEHAFGGAGVDKFRITGIETSAGLDPNSPTAFVTGLTFADIGSASMHMTALVQVVPEPKSYAMLLAGLGLVGWRLHKAKG